MKNKKSQIEYKVIWDEESECFVASISSSDIIGCGDSEEEALLHLKNHLADEADKPRKRPGRPKKFKQKIAPEVTEETLQKIALLKEIFGGSLNSQGDVIDESIRIFYDFASKIKRDMPDNLGKVA